MKKFIGIEHPTPKRGRYEYDIYRVTRNELIYLGSSSISYASTRGQQDEVMNWLSQNGHLPKKYQGYYHNFVSHSSDKNPFKISYKV